MKQLVNVGRVASLAFAVLFTVALPLAVQADAPPYLLNPISCDNFLCLATSIIRFFLGGVALFATLMFIYGGYVFLMSAGNAEAVKKGKDILLWSTIGIVIILGSWVAISYVLKVLMSTTSKT